MVSTFTTRNQLEKPALGDFKNTWGDEVNVNWDVVDLALDGSVSKSATATLTTANGAVDESVCRIITYTGSSPGQITIPAVEKWYKVRNTGTNRCVITCGVGATVTIPQGTCGEVYCSGSACFLMSAKRMWSLIQSSATTSGTSVNFDGNNLNIKHFDELLLRFKGVSHNNGAAQDLRLGVQASPSAYYVLGNFVAANTVYGAIRISGHVYTDTEETPDLSGCMVGALANLSASGSVVGTAGGVSIPFIFGGAGLNITIDFSGATFDGGLIALYGK